jgi:ubiquinone/menaquinone biosynthesis C-methylase UbiE
MEQPPPFDHAWSNVHPTAAPPQLLYLDTLRVTDFGQFYKRQSFDLLDVHVGHRLLDLGCGAGDDVRALAQLTGASGSVVGVDANEAMIREARQRSANQPLPVQFYHSDAHALPFPDGTFDRCRADRVFQHLQNPRVALQELVRVAKPGARIVVSEPDWETLVLDSAERDITRKIVHFICDRIVRNGWIGRQLPRLFKECGLINIVVTTGAFVLTDYTLADRLWGLERNAKRASEAGVISEDQQTRWVEGLRQAAQQGCFFGTASGFGVGGTKPNQSG